MPNFYNLLKPFKMIENPFTNPDFNTDLYVHSLVLFTFLTLLFVVYLMKLTTNSFKSSINNLLEQSIKPEIDKLKKTSLIKSNIFNLNLNLKGLMNKIDTPDKYIENNTYNIKKMLLIINVLLWVFIIGFVIIFNINSCDSKINWIELIISTIITFAFIGFIEFIFLIFIIMKFIPIEPSYLSQKILEKTKQKFN